MPTFNQLCNKFRKKKRRLNKTPALERCPQKKGICIKLVLRTPRKPNSALRKLAKVLLSNRRKVYSYVPGEGPHNLQPFSRILMRGGRAQDMPGIKYRLIRGKFDLPGLKNRKTSRSKYGTKNLNRYL